MKRVLKKENRVKVINDIPYIEAENDTVDFCLGGTVEEASEVMRKLLCLTSCVDADSQKKVN